MAILVSVLCIAVGIILAKYGISFIIGGMGGILASLGLKDSDDDSDE